MSGWRGRNRCCLCPHDRLGRRCRRNGISLTGSGGGRGAVCPGGSAGKSVASMSARAHQHVGERPPTPQPAVKPPGGLSIEPEGHGPSTSRAPAQAVVVTSSLLCTALYALRICVLLHAIVVLRASPSRYTSCCSSSVLSGRSRCCLLRVTCCPPGVMGPRPVAYEPVGRRLVARMPLPVGRWVDCGPCLRAPAACWPWAVGPGSVAVQVEGRLLFVVPCWGAG